MAACVFCDIVAGTSPAFRIHENERSLCILDIQPLARGHCLVIPKRHVPWWHELDDQETASLFGLAREVANRMMAVYKPDFVCVYARGRRIPHTHIFLVPSVAGDVLDSHFNTLERFQEAPQLLTQFAKEEELREAARRLCDG